MKNALSEDLSVGGGMLHEDDTVSGHFYGSC